MAQHTYRVTYPGDIVKVVKWTPAYALRAIRAGIKVTLVK
jgi:hypothetical protein